MKKILILFSALICFCFGQSLPNSVEVETAVLKGIVNDQMVLHRKHLKIAKDMRNWSPIGLLGASLINSGFSTFFEYPNVVSAPFFLVPLACGYLYFRAKSVANHSRDLAVQACKTLESRNEMNSVEECIKLSQEYPKLFSKNS